MPLSGTLRPAAFVASLRHELSLRNRIYAERLGLAMCESYGQPPAICYLATQNGKAHGNFLPESYQAILKNENWRGRLSKAHSQGKSALPRRDTPWKELDSCNSSDALLMNIFCYPGMLRQPRLASLLGTESEVSPEFGMKAPVPLANGRTDRTEVDMRFGDLLVEAKLTESDFQCREASVVGRTAILTRFSIAASCRTRTVSTFISADPECSSRLCKRLLVLCDGRCAPSRFVGSLVCSHAQRADRRFSSALQNANVAGTGGSSAA